MSQRRRILLGWCVAVLLLLSIFSAYEAIYYGWLTATPLSFEQLQAVRSRHRAWLGVGLVSLIWAVVVLIQLYRSRVRRGFEVTSAEQ